MCHLKMFRSFISQLRGSIWWYFYPSSVSGKYFPVIPGPCQLCSRSLSCLVHLGLVIRGQCAMAALHDIDIDNVPQYPGLRSEGAECGICIQAARSHNILMRQMSMFVHFPAAL